ncbi:hypothetical protein FIV42_16985 [Persicimonas caeni]|uniref:Uncharacterized protein n=1 Tax=Persicimonas caeni TaxID=2292766 RepID=A0A4Y6PVI9_PERCE|nr:hypothetical protein [Persicimonas caeni]QDG52374.1 hypothetical protein FIV42_16985 [Persicimonas caeni]QED33596.1 hypothetical protein FRD00_16980 [Persicimonas caeni]
MGCRTAFRLKWLKDEPSERMISCPRCHTQMELNELGEPISSNLADEDEDDSFVDVPEPPIPEGLSTVSSSVSGLTDQELADMESLANALRAEGSNSRASKDLDGLLDSARSAPPESNLRTETPAGGITKPEGEGGDYQRSMSDDDLRRRLESIMERAGVESSEASSPRSTWDLGSREASESEGMAETTNPYNDDTPVPPANSPYRTNLSARPLPTAELRDEPSWGEQRRKPVGEEPSTPDVRRTQPVPRPEAGKEARSKQETSRMPGISVAGRAGEARGSGFIFLPTPEIRESLAEGPYRLRVAGKEYGPVDDAGLVELIKHGALLGGEEIATLDGPWVRVVHHPAFTQLRSKMARGAHEVLREMSVQGRSVEKSEQPRKRQNTRTAYPPVRRADEGHSGFIVLPTKEIHSSIEHGRYRLRINGKIHGPVEASDIVLLIKHGALLGADEIATLDGPWMPVTMHPAFKELRRRMAAGAHGVLRELGAEGKPEPAAAKKRVEAKKPAAPKKPVEEKKPAPPKKSAPPKESAPPKKSAAPKKPAPPKKPVEKKKSAPPKKPVEAKKPAPPKKPVVEKKPVEKKKPIEKKKPAAPTQPTRSEVDAASGGWGRLVVLLALIVALLAALYVWQFA